MFSVVKNSQVNMRIIRPTLLNSVNQRGYACAHAGTFKPLRKPKVSDIDVSGKHKVVVVTECNQIDCKTKNCADPSSPITCPNRTATQNARVPDGILQVHLL